MEDKILFKGSKNDDFSVKSMYMVLDCSPQVAFPYRSIWNPVIPPRMGFFAWEASWGKMLTLDQLKHHGRTLTNRCFFCEEDEEDINHLLLYCKKARMLWDLLLSIVGTCWVSPDSVIQMLISWQGAPVGKKRKNIWIAVPVCLFWIVWHNRNMLFFENRATSDQRTKIFFLSKLWTLANTHSVDNMNYLVDFLTWLGSR